jgi:hypothetical protein
MMAQKFKREFRQAGKNDEETKFSYQQTLREAKPKAKEDKC